MRRNCTCRGCFIYTRAGTGVSHFEPPPQQLWLQSRRLPPSSFKASLSASSVAPISIRNPEINATLECHETHNQVKTKTACHGVVSLSPALPSALAAWYSGRCDFSRRDGASVSLFAWLMVQIAAP